MRDQMGIADVLAIAFMFLLIVFSGTMLHAWAKGPMASSLDRQLQQKTEHLYKTLELAHVENYSISYLYAIVDNLVLAQPTVESEYLKMRLDNALAYLRPSGFGVWVNLVCPSEGTTWSQVHPSDAGPPTLETKQFTFKGKISMIRAEAAGDRVVGVDVAVVIFKL